MKGILKKILGRGKLTVMAVVVALTVGTATTALAANGDPLRVGLANTATAITKLTANIANPALHLVNTSTSAGATALNLQTAASMPPMKVNSSTKVANLNADKLDGFDSAALPGSIASVSRFAGPTGTIPTGASYQFAGPTVQVTTTASQSLVGSAEAPLGVSAGKITHFHYGLCYQPSAGGSITNFYGGSDSFGEIDTTRQPYAADGAVNPGAGTWTVGYCVLNDNSEGLSIDNTDYVNGYVEVVNKPAKALNTSSGAGDNVQERSSDNKK